MSRAFSASGLCLVAQSWRSIHVGVHPAIIALCLSKAVVGSPVAAAPCQLKPIVSNIEVAGSLSGPGAEAAYTLRARYEFDQAGSYDAAFREVVTADLRNIQEHYLQLVQAAPYHDESEPPPEIEGAWLTLESNWSARAKVVVDSDGPSDQSSPCGTTVICFVFEFVSRDGELMLTAAHQAGERDEIEADGAMPYIGRVSAAALRPLELVLREINDRFAVTGFLLRGPIGFMPAVDDRTARFVNLEGNLGLEIRSVARTSRPIACFISQIVPTPEVAGFFTEPSKYFRRESRGWAEYDGGQEDPRFEYHEVARAEGYFILYDSKRRIYLRLPARGGIADWGLTRYGPWYPMYEVQPQWAE